MRAVQAPTVRLDGRPDVCATYLLLRREGDRRPSAALSPRAVRAARHAVDQQLSAPTAAPPWSRHQRADDGERPQAAHAARERVTVHDALCRRRPDAGAAKGAAPLPSCSGYGGCPCSAAAAEGAAAARGDVQRLSPPPPPTPPARTRTPPPPRRRTRARAPSTSRGGGGGGAARPHAGRRRVGWGARRRAVGTRARSRSRMQTHVTIPVMTYGSAGPGSARVEMYSPVGY